MSPYRTPYVTRSLAFLLFMAVAMFGLLLVERSLEASAATALTRIVSTAGKGNPTPPGNGNPKPCNNPGKADQKSRNCNPSKG